MKIAILFESMPSGGGAFTHSLNATLDMIKFLKKDNKFKVFTNSIENTKILNKNRIKSEYFYHSFLDKMLIYLSTKNFLRFFFKIFNITISLEKKINFQNFDFIFFPILSNTVFSLNRTRFVTTLLDLEHFKHSIFPEITKKEFNYREKLHFYSLPKSVLIITSYPSIKKELCKYYSIKKDKVILIPYTPGRFSRINNYRDKKLENVKNYFFYPAQIWGHKNHIIILKAIKFLKEKFNINPSLILSGRDRGYKKILMEYINKNGLKENVIFTGYVSSEKMNYLYKKCKCVIFTSLFGPNAIPPLEAWKYKKPIIINKKLKDVQKDNGFLVNVNDYKDVAKAMKKVLMNKYPVRLLKNGSKKLLKIERDNKKRYIFLEKNLNKYFG